MPARAVRPGAGRRATKRRTADAVAADRAAALGQEGGDEWMEVEESSDRLDEGAMEMLLTGHAATHGIEGEDNWLIESEETKWGER